MPDAQYAMLYYDWPVVGRAVKCALLYDATSQVYYHALEPILNMFDIGWYHRYDGGGGVGDAVSYLSRGQRGSRHLSNTNLQWTATGPSETRMAFFTLVR